MKISRFLCVPAAWLGLLALSVWAAGPGGTMSVQVKNTALRASPAFIGKAIATLSYGDQVAVIESQGPWIKVGASGGLTGWAHTSALTPKRIVLQSGRETARTKASGDELALAGKGFNSDVEGEFRKQHRNIDFTWIDRMEKTRVSPGEMQSFLKAGGITPGKGGAQ
ncbi:MAG: SH3 domain-containing protein [Kiritimatiellae bacterium]|nr:SH3 domain-containing protein [Kiritimatiellia bacterium]